MSDGDRPVPGRAEPGSRSDVEWDAGGVGLLRSEQDVLEELNRLRVIAARRRGKVRLSLQDLEALSGVPKSSLANYLSGRTLMPADVLDRVVLALGVAPAQARVWAQTWERVTTQPSAKSAALARPSVPAQLPAGIPGFAGRQAALDQLDALLEHVARHPTAPFVCVISGTAGVGKTTLAVHWAQRVVDRFPDGQLYVNLRGFHPSGRVMSPDEAIRGFLDALGEAPYRIPAADLDAQAARYRSLLAGRRVLVVLDNARDAEQVRHLLPGTPNCLALVTSRNQLAGLVAAENAHPLTLELLTVEESRQLLALRIGADRVTAEAATVDEIISRCARLPLAMSVAAARIVTRPNFPLHAVADRLRDIGGALDAFADPEASIDARSVFSWSYHALSPMASRLFRLLGLSPGFGITTAAAASLIGAPVRQTRHTLGELTQAHLLSEHTPDRFTLHDLLRAYANELTERQESAADRRAALHRLLDHYLHTAYAADQLLYRHRHSIRLARPSDGVTLEKLTGTDQALDWFIRERPVLLAVFEQAAAGSFDRHLWQLAWAMTTFLQRQGHWTDWAAVLSTALDAARRLGDEVGQAHTHRGLARAYARLRRHDEARHHLRQALDLFVALDDPIGQAVSQLSLAWAYHREERHCEAFVSARQALDRYRVIGHRAGQADTLNLIGWLYVRSDRPEEAIAACEQALEVLTGITDHDIEAGNWECLGRAHHVLGNDGRASACYQRALELYRRIGHRHGEAEVLTVLGDIRQAVGNHHAAHQTWREALHILDQLRHPDADHLRGRLRARQG